ERDRLLRREALSEVVPLEQPGDGEGPRQSHDLGEGQRREPLAVETHLGLVSVEDAERLVGEALRVRVELLVRRHWSVGGRPRRRRLSVVPRDLPPRAREARVALAAPSEQFALAELYDRYRRPAYGLALRVLRDEALAEDAVQEAFLALWRTAARFVPERSSARTWILTLVHRRAVDLVRREERRRAEPLESAAAPAGGGAADDARLPPP